MKLIKQKGFTAVELAGAVVIVGLFVGGISVAIHFISKFW